MRRGSAKDVFDRWTPIWHAFFYVMIVTATGTVVASGDLRSDGARAKAIGLALALTAWHAVMIVRPGPGHRARPTQVATYLAIALVLSTLLLGIHPVFLMV